MNFTTEELKCIRVLVEDSISLSTWDALDESSLSDVEYMHFFLQRAKVLAKLEDLYND
jgi:hypothetical protein